MKPENYTLNMFIKNPFLGVMVGMCGIFGGE